MALRALLDAGVKTGALDARVGLVKGVEQHLDVELVHLAEEEGKMRHGNHKDCEHQMLPDKRRNSKGKRPDRAVLGLKKEGTQIVLVENRKRRKEQKRNT